MKLNIRKQIIIMFSLVIFVGNAAIAWFMGNNMYDKIIEAAQEKLKSDLAMAKIVLDEKYPGEWQIKNNKIYKGETEINNNFTVVDLIGELTGDTVTVFQGDTRVSTNVITNEGERAIGTKVSDAVAQASLIEERQYIGKAEVAGIINQTIYEPIKDNNKVIGILYVGVPNTPYDKMASNFKIATYIFGLISVIIGCFIAWIFSGKLCKNISIIKGATDKIAKGDLDVNIDIKTQDEVGNLAKSLKNMADNLNEVMTNINFASEQVASGSKQISDSSIALSQGTTEQASAIEELTSSIEELSAQTQKNAEGANNANELEDKAKANADKGNKQMQEMLKAMEEINVSSNNISKIIKVIDEIAFQTNILALNAAVESARAGQYGKGFAVVAEEVRNLAARSANAAKETTELIEGSIRKVEDGTKIANETANALKKIINDIDEAAALVNDIAIASNEQAIGINQINQGIMQVSQVVQTNSATSEEGAAASEELSSQAELLKKQVKKFKLKDVSDLNLSFAYENEKSKIMHENSDEYLDKNKDEKTETKTDLNDTELLKQ